MNNYAALLDPKSITAGEKLFLGQQLVDTIAKTLGVTVNFPGQSSDDEESGDNFHSSSDAISLDG